MSPIPRPRPFTQVDVFSREPYLGNPVAVVLDGTDLTDDAMARFARWTNLSETTFVLPPTDPDADYRLRIWTPDRELPFAGHPTLGSAHAWLTAGNTARAKDVIVQECAAGLVRIRPSDDGALTFEAPPTDRTGDLGPELLGGVTAALGLRDEQVVAHQWVDNGPGWAALLLAGAEDVLAIEPDLPALHGAKIGVVGPSPQGSPHQFEVRAFVGGAGGYEDPVTGSLNASLAQWLIRTDRAPANYIARQGTLMGRSGLVTVTPDGDHVFVGGHCTACIDGTVLL
ncbi:PhzF family phenazine biosynthesis protein [Kocuria marina]|uniref:PhzF family phenazine biosynthesis protein n=1 Tax=Kocuria marina TaxID=223184 RepID=UPI0022DF251B|nr:PhzF family phenazine biosynthesis protein [Kocuria marina]